MNRIVSALAITFVLVTAACAPRVSVPTGELQPEDAPRQLTREDINTEAVNASPTQLMLRSEAGPVVVRAQILLDRARFSPGVIDGQVNKNTALAISWFQKTQKLPVTATLDTATYSRLLAVAGQGAPIIQITVDAEMLAGPFVTLPRNVYEQAKLSCLCYASVTEKLAERFHSSLEVMRKLNPGVGFAALKPGDRIWAPAVTVAGTDAMRVARIEISRKESYVHAYAADGTLLYHFPSTLGSKYDPSPSGRYRVTGVAWNPVFRYDPTLFSDVSDDKPKTRLPPGPNSPVGRVWIALSKEHVGIHGTPTPDTIGFASSHGCVRLTNWDATKLALSTSAGTPVQFL